MCGGWAAAMSSAQSNRAGLASVASRSRLAIMLVAGLASATGTGIAGLWGYAPLAGWDVAALIFTGWVWLTIVPLSSRRTAAHATREDPGRAVTDLIVLSAAVASLASVGFVILRAGSAHGAIQEWLAGFGVLSVALSWFTVHTLFALRYARLYYTGSDGGITFNQEAPPRYVDFAYVAFTIGMTFQVSDTNLESPTMRATALRHALLSYLFGAVILAGTINLIAGLGTSSGG